MEVIYEIITFLFPFQFLEMTFMKHAFLGILIAAPLLALLSTMVVNQKMAFFSDAIGHSALTGIGIGVMLGVRSTQLSMLLFAVLLGVAIAYFNHKYPHMTDTLIGTFSAVAIALGTMILSKGGNFNQYTVVLIGDLLSITPKDLAILFMVGCILVALWYLIFNQLVLMSLNTSLANSRHIHTFKLQMLFMVIVAVVVILCIPWIGVLLINAFLILPAAISRNIAQDMRSYEIYAIVIAVISGVIGLSISYYLGTSAGATIVVLMGVFYILSYIYGYFIKR